MLRTVIDGINDSEVGCRQQDESDIGREFEVEMVRALSRVAVRHKTGKAAARNEAQWRNWILRWRARGIRQEQAAERRRRHTGVVEFEEVVIGRELRVGKPLIDFQMMEITESRICVRRAKGRFAQSPCAIRHPANRVVVQLDAEVDRVNQRTTACRLVIQGNIIATLFQRKTEMNARRCRNAVSRQHEICAGRKRRRPWRKHKLAWRARAVGEAHVHQINRHGPIIIQLDHVRERAAVVERRNVLRQNFVDANRWLRRRNVARVHRPGP